MIPLETLSTLLSVGETELIEELIIALLASPQLALFFEKFPGLKKRCCAMCHAGERRLTLSSKPRRFRPRWPKSFSCSSGYNSSAIVNSATS